MVRRQRRLGRVGRYSHAGLIRAAASNPCQADGCNAAYDFSTMRGVIRLRVTAKLFAMARRGLATVRPQAQRCVDPVHRAVVDGLARSGQAPNLTRHP